MLLERACEAQDVLALRQAPQAEERRTVGHPADLRPRSLRVSRRETHEVDAAVHDLGLAVSLRHRGVQPLP